MKTKNRLLRKEGVEASSKKKRKEPVFRIGAKSLFLTYPRCDLRLREVLEQLKKLLSTFIVSDYVLSRERHEDGSSHVHVYLKTRKKCDIKNANLLDLAEIEESGERKVFHGNYQSAKRPNWVIEYILKGVTRKDDENVLFSESVSDRVDALGTWLSFGEAVVSLAESNRIAEALDLYKREKPELYARSSVAIERGLQAVAVRKAGFRLKYDLSRFDPPAELEKRLSELSEGAGYVLFIVGKPGTGKTQYIQSYGEAKGWKMLKISDPDGMREFRSGHHDVIVMDDMNFSKYECDREGLISLLETESYMTVLFKHGSASVPPTIKIALSNKPLKSYIGALADDEAIKRRYREFDLKDSSLIKEIHESQIKDEIKILSISG